MKIIITNQAASTINEIFERYILEETPEIFEEKIKNKKPLNLTVLYLSVKKFSEEIIDEKGLIEELQKNLEIDAKKAGEVANELITKVVPLLQKVTEEQLADPDFLDEFDRKYFGGPGKAKPVNSTAGQGSGFSGANDIFPNAESLGTSTDDSTTGHSLPKQIKPIFEPEEIIQQAPVQTPTAQQQTETMPTPKKRGRPAKVESAQPPSIMPAQPKNYGSDNYREPIE